MLPLRAEQRAGRTSNHERRHPGQVNEEASAAGAAGDDLFVVVVGASESTAAEGGGGGRQGEGERGSG